MSIDTKALLALARAATQTVGWPSSYQSANDAAFIAAASPDVVLALCKRVEELEAEIRALVTPLR